MLEAVKLIYKQKAFRPIVHDQEGRTVMNGEKLTNIVSDFFSNEFLKNEAALVIVNSGAPIYNQKYPFLPPTVQTTLKTHLLPLVLSTGF